MPGDMIAPAAAQPQRRIVWPAAILLVGFVVLVIAAYRTFVPDDLFIYLRFARHVLEGHGPAYNIGRATYGFTSALWLGLITLPGLLGADLLTGARALSLGSSLLALAAIALFTLRLSGSRRAAFAACALLAVDAWFLRWACTGMETSLAAAIVLLAFARRLGEERAGKAPFGSIALFAVLTLLRPEAFLLLALALGDACLPGGGGQSRDSRPARRIGRVAALVAVALAVVGPWLMYAWFTFGHLLPDTAPAKGEPGAALARAGGSLLRTCSLAGVTSAIPILLLVVAAPLLWRAAGGVRPALARRHRLLAAWIVALPFLYAATAVTAYSRYLLIWTPLLLATGIATWDRLATARNLRPAIWALPLVLVAAQNLGLGAFEIAPASAAYARSLQRVNVGIGRWLQENTPEDAVVAAENIGAIGYVSERHILDLNGLISPKVIPYKRAGEIDRFLEEFPPDYVIKIDPHPDPWHESGPRLHLEPLLILEYDSMFLDQEAPLYYTLYRVGRVR
jgi:hypothetical protein